MKRALRAAMRERRRSLHAEIPEAGRRLAEACSDHEILKRPDAYARLCVASHHPIGSEIDIMPLALMLHARGVALAFPAVRGRHLIFRRHDPETPFAPDDLGVPAPPDGAPMVSPNVVLVPLLAFDILGTRLGYGGGWYDRALWTLKRTHSDLCVYGTAFSGQKVDYVPRQSHDFPLDGVFTELGAVPAAS